MQTDPNSQTSLLKPLVRDEYTALRAEILKRIELRQQIIAILLTLTGIMLSFGLANPAIALLFPPIATSLAFGWYQNDSRIGELARYIRERLENPITGLSYETYVQETRILSKVSWFKRMIVLSHGGMILITQILAVGIAVVQYPFPFVGITAGAWILLGVDFFSILIVCVLLTKSRR